MTGKSVHRDGGYEHAGGYQSGVSLWPSWRETAFGIALGLLWVGANRLLHALLGQGPASHGFNLALGVVGLGWGAWMIFRPDRVITEDSVPTSLLYPEQIDEDSAARRRRARIWGALIVIFALAGSAYALVNLLGAEGGR